MLGVKSQAKLAVEAMKALALSLEGDVGGGRDQDASRDPLTLGRLRHDASHRLAIWWRFRGLPAPNGLSTCGFQHVSAQNG